MLYASKLKDSETVYACKVTSKISPDTRGAILDAAWELMAGQGRLGAGMADIAAAAGVSRQTLFLAFGNRAGLLVAMARHRDTKSESVERMRALASGHGADAATLHAFVDAWLDYLPLVYPVAIQLEAASLTDADAAAAWHDRIFGQGVRLGLDLILSRMAAAGALPAALHPRAAADACLALLVPSAWRYLVAERGWSADGFAASRHVLIDAILTGGPATPGPPRARPPRAGRRRA